MKKLILTIFFFSLLFSHSAFAQPSDIIRKYIATYKDIAIEEMLRTGVPASITLAQGIHETFAGQSVLVLKSNNHFGIKCKTGWTGESVSHDDDARGECFRKYASALDSYRDHSDFLKNRSHYASLFQLDPTDYEGWAFGLKKAGYATNPKYPQVLIKLIKDYNLHDYTLIALNLKKEDQEILAKNQEVISKEVESKMGISISEIEEISSPKPEYPEGIFKINETTVTFITKGTSFIAIADQYNIPLARLFEFNDMRPADVAENDQLIFLQRKRKTGANEFHIITEGETIYDISQTEGIRIESILEYNFLKYNMQPEIGEKIYLQTAAPSMPKLAQLNRPLLHTASNNGKEAAYLVHVVQPKETLYYITKKYSVSIDELVKWNDLETSELKTGQQLRINKKE